jgi:transcriptional regulator with XRE-family HTH domain
MQRKANLIGQNVAKFRYQRNWTQEELVAKLQLLGCYMTRDILANIETQRRIVTDTQVRFFAEVFGVAEGDLFPPKRQANQTMWLVDQLTDRQRHRRQSANEPPPAGR